MSEKTTMVAGTLTHIDALGRVTIPKGMRDRLGLRARSQVVVSGDAESITVRKYAPQGDLSVNIDALEIQIEEMRYNADVPVTVVEQLTDMISDMRDVVALIGKPSRTDEQ